MSTSAATSTPAIRVRRILIIAFAATLLSLTWPILAAEVAESPRAADAPLTTAEALASFRLEPGLRIELVAAEPLVESPVAVAWDERGRMFVVENRGYPTGPSVGQPPQGRIALLEDTNHDGTLDHRVEFADGLTFPNGLMPWRGGLLVTCAPDLLYLKDTDGDGRADVRQVWFTGFSTDGSTQLRASHPILAIDNWIYVTGGLTGGKISSPAWPDRPAVDLARADFRFRPERNEIESAAFESADGGGQFGMTFDEFGRRFICYNRCQIQHVVLASRYLRRNPHLAFAKTIHNCPAELGAEPLPGHAAAARLYPISANITTADSHAGAFTAACGVTIFRGTGLPDEYHGGAFSCDPTGNLVHFDRLEPQGATFAAHRSPQPVEFLASSDNWFRPVNLAVGPDGALTICDMYRKTIEHPDYLPGDVRRQTDFEAGKDRGRIYRVVAADSREPAASDDVGLNRAMLNRAPLNATNVEQLCSALRAAEGWRRDTVQRLLLERRDPAAAPHLAKLLNDPDAPPVAVVHALRLLDALGSLDSSQLKAAFAHPVAGVREQALQMAESRFFVDASLLPAVLPLAGDSDARVRFQWALSVPGSIGPQVIEQIAKIAARDAADPWLRAAALSSIHCQDLRFLRSLVLRPSATAGMPALCEEVGRLMATSLLPPKDLAEALRVIATQRPGVRTYEEQTLLLAGFAEGLKRRPKGATLTAFLQSAGADLAEQRDRIASHASIHVDVAHDADEPAEFKIAALKLLGSDPALAAGADLLDLADARHPAVQAAAIAALAARQDSRLAKHLLTPERFAHYSPSQRSEVLESLLAQPPFLSDVLDAIESGAVGRGVVDSIHRRRLSEHRDPAIRDRAARLFSVAAVGDRAKVYEEYKSVAELPGHAAPGRQVFAKSCANCHRLNREGYAVGPDLFGIRNQPKQTILLHMLLPEFEIAPGFAVYLVETKDGRVIAGILIAQTDDSVTLRQVLGKEETILRSDIETLTASKLSLMPQELEKTMSRQDIADLLAYLKGEPD